MSHICKVFSFFCFVGHLVLSLSLKSLAKARLLLYNSPKRFINHISLREGIDRYESNIYQVQLSITDF